MVAPSTSRQKASIGPISGTSRLMPMPLGNDRPKSSAFIQGVLVRFIAMIGRPPLLDYLSPPCWRAGVQHGQMLAPEERARIAGVFLGALAPSTRKRLRQWEHRSIGHVF